MDPRDLLRAFPDGIPCTVCNETVPIARIQLLARRDDMTFVQVDCAACRSTSLGFLADPARRPGVAEPADPDAPPISTDDVIEMHQFLASWRGDVHGLVSDHRDGITGNERSMPPR